MSKLKEFLLNESSSTKKIKLGDGYSFNGLLIGKNKFKAFGGKPGVWGTWPKTIDIKGQVWIDIDHLEYEMEGYTDDPKNWILTANFYILLEDGYLSVIDDKNLPPLIYTDPTFKKSVNDYLKKVCKFDPKIRYTEQGMQSDSHVSMYGNDQFAMWVFGKLGKFH